MQGMGCSIDPWIQLVNVNTNRSGKWPEPGGGIRVHDYSPMIPDYFQTREALEKTGVVRCRT